MHIGYTVLTVAAIAGAGFGAAAAHAQQKASATPSMVVYKSPT